MKLRISDHLLYILKRISAQSCESTPPAPCFIPMIAFLESNSPSNFRERDNFLYVLSSWIKSELIVWTPESSSRSTEISHNSTISFDLFSRNLNWSSLSFLDFRSFRKDWAFKLSFHKFLSELFFSSSIISFSNFSWSNFPQNIRDKIS